MAVQTLAVPTYTAAMLSKGPLVLRLLAETMGREKLTAAIAPLISGPSTRLVTYSDLKQALIKSGGSEIETQLGQWVETIVEPDVVIGVPLPSDRPNSQKVNLRNLGTGDVNVSVLAVTASGKRLTTTVKVPSEDVVSAEIPTAEKVETVEVDPDKLIIQTNYDNDRRPPRPSGYTLFNDSIAAFNKGEFAHAESNLGQVVRLDPSNSLARAWLARALQALGKSDQAASEATAAINVVPPMSSALAWAYITLGQVAMSKNQPAEAAEHFRRAIAEAEEAPAQFAGREALARAQRAANPSQPTGDPSVRSFVAQLDNLIKEPSSDTLFTVVMKSTLKRFVQGLTVSPPTSWSTEILREDRIDANRVALDVSLKVRTAGRDQTGTAVFVLFRTAGSWVLEDVQLFNVK
jgi:hypothetical protein